MIKASKNPISTYQGTNSENDLNNKKGFFHHISNIDSNQSQKTIISLQDPQPITSQLQQKSLELQKHLILQSIQQYRSLNMQQKFPSLIKYLQQSSLKYITLQNIFNSLNQSSSTQQKQQQSVINNLKSNIEQMESHLFLIDGEELVKHEYEKVLLLGLLGGFEVRMKELIEEKEQRKEENSILMEVKHRLQSQIAKEKQLIVKLAIMKQKLTQQLNYNKNCQLEPIHMLKQKNLKHFQTKTHLFQTKFIQGICNTIYHQHQQFTQKQQSLYHHLLSHQPVQDSLSLQHNISYLQSQLNHLTEAKLKTSNQISLEMMKQQILTQELQLKEEESKKYCQLLQYVNKQPYCIEVASGLFGSCDDMKKQVVTINELAQKVSIEKEENLELKDRLKDVSEKLSLLKHHQKQLKTLLDKVKNDHKVRQQKLLLQNQLLKLNLQQKHLLYQSKLNLSPQQHSPIKKTISKRSSPIKINPIINPATHNVYPAVNQRSHTRWNSNHNLYDGYGKQVTNSTQSRIDSIIQSDNNSTSIPTIIPFVQSKIFQNIQNTIQPKTQSKFQSIKQQYPQSPKYNLAQKLPQNNSPIDPRISQLRSRLMAKFQAISKNS